MFGVFRVGNNTKGNFGVVAKVPLRAPSCSLFDREHTERAAAWQITIAASAIVEGEKGLSQWSSRHGPGVVD